MRGKQPVEPHIPNSNERILSGSSFSASSVFANISRSAAPCSGDTSSARSGSSPYPQSPSICRVESEHVLTGDGPQPDSRASGKCKRPDCQRTCLLKRPACCSGVLEQILSQIGMQVRPIRKRTMRPALPRAHQPRCGYVRHPLRPDCPIQG